MATVWPRVLHSSNKINELGIQLFTKDTLCPVFFFYSKYSTLFRRTKEKKKENSFLNLVWYTGIHCRGKDLAFFPPRRIFFLTNVYICSENAAHIGGFYFMWLATSERRVPDFIVLFMFISVGKLMEGK